jgi:hypothetical protein
MKDAPVWETAGLLAVLGLMAIPLAAVTREQPRPAEPEAVTVAAHDMVETVVRVRAAHPFQSLELRRDSEVLGRLEGPATEGEFTCRLNGDEDWVVIEADLAEGDALTAFGIEFWPEGLPTVEETFWGRGRMVEELQIRWLDE